MELLSDRLYIRPIEKGDAYSLFEYRSDHETNKYQGWIPERVEDASDFIGKTAREIDIPGTWFQLVIIDKEKNQHIGDIGIHFFDDENQQVEIGCTLRQDCQGKGLACEALRITIDFIFHNLKKHRIIGSIDPDNKKSIKMVERLGFRKEAHFKESIYSNGKWLDDVVYGLLSKEWSGL